MILRSAGTLFALLVLLGRGLDGSAAADVPGCTSGPHGGFSSATCGSQVEVFDAGQAAAQGAPTANSGMGDRWQRHEVCREWYTDEIGKVRFPGKWPGSIPDCSTGVLVPDDLCATGEQPMPPWWVSRQQRDGTYEPWYQVTSYQCTADILAALAEQEWRRMPIAPNTYDMQPATGYAVADLGVVLVVDRNPRTMNATLLGTPVVIRAVPTAYTWTASDGSHWTTTDPGLPWDKGGAPFTFAKSEHRVTFTLTTTWRGEFSTDAGATWRDAPGTATTTSATTTVHVYHPHTHVVDCDLSGRCGTDGGTSDNLQDLLDPDGDGIDNYLIPDDKIGQYLDARDAGKTWTDQKRKTQAQIASQTDGR